ncbi:hypothetical protein M407DRAFT_31774 [Tulasnella calospora MUT 4182]|uniref:Cytochrome P450 n=1 Tax=Tulasnella calospora MUT 4182 TaxID=1051891 RepID=A0A0C3KAY3_9AGAM|nr:hypothetical protein M407DRAFT_31774 [Tulasnella calospora MUT 4182]
MARILSFDNGQKWEKKYSLFSDAGWDVIAIASPLWPNPIELMVADPVSIKTITGNRILFPKPLELYSALTLYGTNLVTTEGNLWSRHRRLVNPSFQETSIRYVWEQTVRIVNEMFDDWGESPQHVNNVCALTKDIALLVIGAVAFGRKANWGSQSSPRPEGHEMHFHDTLRIVSEKVLLRLALPPWVWGNKETRERMGLGGIPSKGWLGSTVKEAAIAFAELELYMEEMIDERTTGGFEGRRDIMGQLMNATGEDASDRLSKRDVIGNTYIFLFAGHETTAHSLAFLFGLLALDQDEQEALYNHINSVLGDREPVYEDLSSLNLVLGAFYESLRLYSPVMNIPKLSGHDTTIPVMPAVKDDGTQMDPSAKPKSLFIPKGTPIYLYTSAVHYNPRYWKDPYAFRPARFLDPEWPREAFIPFSAGPRACIGRRFAEVEATAIISLVLKHYKITVDEARLPSIPGESVVAQRERLLGTSQDLLLTPTNCPLVFTKRQ